MTNPNPDVYGGRTQAGRRAGWPLGGGQGCRKEARLAGLGADARRREVTLHATPDFFREASVRIAAVARAVLGCVALFGANATALTAEVATDSFTIRSEVLGEPRLINVHRPAAANTSSAPLAVLYMPDGGIDEDFPHVVATVDSLVARGAMRPVIVVGIPNTQRRRDLTGPTRVASDSAIAPRVGGSAAFRAFVRDELIPEIASRYAVTRERGIIGESLAGLFIVETFLLEPALFDHYIALDPSLWWNDGELADSAAALMRAHPSLERSLLVCSTGDGIVEPIARFAAHLETSAPSGLRWRYEPRPDLTHATVYRAMKASALVDAFPP